MQPHTSHTYHEDACLEGCDLHRKYLGLFMMAKHTFPVYHNVTSHEDKTEPIL